MSNLFDSNPLTFLLLLGASIVMGVVWIVFPFIVMGRLRKIEEHLSDIRNKTQTNPNESKGEYPAS
jgi:hypothetical protein